MDFVQNIRPEHLQSFWYSASKYCFALVGTFISLLWVTALDTDEAESYKATMHAYQWMLRLSSKSADFLERALSMLATSTGILIKAIPERPNVEAILNRHKPLTSAPGSIHSDQTRNTSQLSAVYESSGVGQSEITPDNAIPCEASLSGDGWDSEHLWLENFEFSD